MSTMSPLNYIGCGLEVEHEGAAGGQEQLAIGQAHGLTGGHVAGSGSLAKYLAVAVELHCALLRRTVDDGYGMAALVFAGDDVDSVFGDELGHLALGDDIVALTPVQ